MNESTNEKTKITKPGIKILYPELSYAITGLCFEVQNTLGRFAREKQYSDALENKLKDKGIKYVREYTVVGTGNRLDFLIDGTIILEIKALPFIGKDEYYQTKRYLDILNFELALLINFRDKYLKPQRVLRNTHSKS